MNGSPKGPQPITQQNLTDQEDDEEEEIFISKEQKKSTEFIQNSNNQYDKSEEEYQEQESTYYETEPNEQNEQEKDLCDEKIKGIIKIFDHIKRFKNDITPSILSNFFNNIIFKSNLNNFEQSNLNTEVKLKSITIWLRMEQFVILKFDLIQIYIQYSFYEQIKSLIVNSNDRSLSIQYSQGLSKTFYFNDLDLIKLISSTLQYICKRISISTY